MGMRLQDRGARPYHFSAFAARVARCRHLSQPTMRFWQRRKVRKSTLASRLSGSIHIHHHVLLLATIPQSTWAGKGRCSLKEIVEKLRAQCLDGWLIQRGEKAGKSRTRGEAVALKQRRNIVGKRSETIIKSGQGGFPTESIAQQHDHEINGVIGSKAGTGKSHVLFERRDDPGLHEHVSHCGHFLHP